MNPICNCRYRERLRELEEILEKARQRELTAAEAKKEQAARLLAELQEERSKLCEEVEQARLETHLAERGLQLNSSRDDESVFQAQQLAGTTLTICRTQWYSTARYTRTHGLSNRVFETACGGTTRSRRQPGAGPYRFGSTVVKCQTAFVKCMCSFRDVAH